MTTSGEQKDVLPWQNTQTESNSLPCEEITNTNSVDRDAVNQLEDASEDTFATAVSEDTATPTYLKTVLILLH